MMKRLFSLFVFIVVGALCAFAQESFPMVLEREMKSEILGTAKKYCIYLPAGYGDEGKDPNPIAKGMSWMKTNMKLSMDDSDHVIADLMTDGCNMGVKSLSKYLNQYKAADETSKDITKRLIKLEAQLVEDIRQYL